MTAGEAAGYRHPAYAAALAGSDAPLALPDAGGWLLVRPIPGDARHDAAGCYPLFACRDWTALESDLRALPPELVSVALVADPFGGYDAALLARCFPDRCVRFKEHFVADLAAAREDGPSAHHRRNVRHARRQVEVEACARPADHAEDWVRLYGHLRARHAIAGPADFSPASLAAQLAVPGIAALRAVRAGRTVGMTLWYEQGDVAYYHLGAYDDAGYASRAAFALFAEAHAYFRPRVRWLALGAGAGVTASADDGLTRFKRGWATGTRTAWFCGRVLDAAAYRALSDARDDGFFPAYRAPSPSPAAARP